MHLVSALPQAARPARARAARPVAKGKSSPPAGRVWAPALRLRATPRLPRPARAGEEEGGGSRPGEDGGGEGDREGGAEEGAGAAVTKFLANLAASPLSYVAGGLVAIKVVASTGEQGVTVLLLAALPITGLTALSKTSFGEEAQKGLEAQLPQLEEEAAAAEARRREARGVSPFYGARRARFLGPVPFEYPAHLEGELPGDAGFDPLGLASEPGALARLRACELLHARWAMLAIVGALLPEALSAAGLELGEAVWWKVGAAKLSGDTLNYAGVDGFRIAGGQGIAIIAACQVVLMGGPEYARYVGLKGLEPVGIFLPGPDPDYPGGAPFDPLNYSLGDPLEYEALKVKEIKNGRLAMVAMAGLFAQGAVTGEGPLANLRAALGS